MKASVSGTHRIPNIFETVTAKEVAKSFVDPPDYSRTLIDHGRVDLDRRCAEADFFIRVLRREHATDPNDLETSARHQRIQIAEA